MRPCVLAEIEQRRRAEELLRQSQKMEIIGQLTGSLAPDFNNPLTVFLSNLEMLQKRADNDPRSQRLIEGALQGATGGVLEPAAIVFCPPTDVGVRTEEST